MMDFQRKRKLKNLVFSYVTIVALLIMIVFMAQSVWERFTVEREMSERRHEVERELHDLKLRAAALESQVEYLEDERGVEAEIRNRFDVVKEGEQVVIILDDESTNEGEAETQAPAEAVPWYKFW